MDLSNSTEPGQTAQDSDKKENEYDSEKIYLIISRTLKKMDEKIKDAVKFALRLDGRLDNSRLDMIDSSNYEEVPDVIIKCMKLNGVYSAQEAASFFQKCFATIGNKCLLDDLSSALQEFHNQSLYKNKMLELANVLQESDVTTIINYLKLVSLENIADPNNGFKLMNLLIKERNFTISRPDLIEDMFSNCPDIKMNHEKLIAELISSMQVSINTSPSIKPKESPQKVDQTDTRIGESTEREHEKPITDNEAIVLIRNILYPSDTKDKPASFEVPGVL